MRRPVQPHVVLEQELQALLQEDLEVGIEDRKGDSGGDDDAKNAIKKRVRVIKNRLAAKRSREQARTYVQQLESTLNALAAHNEFLARRLAAVEAENDTLKRVFSCRPQNAVNTQEQKEFLGEPAVLPTSSLQLDGLFLISMLSLFFGRFFEPVESTHFISQCHPQTLPEVQRRAGSHLSGNLRRRHFRRKPPRPKLPALRWTAC